MGLHVHSLENVPKTENRDYFIYLLDYGWHEPLANTIQDNFNKMATFAAKNRAVIIKGTEGHHFENEVFSWHKINNEQGENILPSILITNAHPSYFHHESYRHSKSKGLCRESVDSDLKLVLVPLKRFCTNTSDVITLIEGIFFDIESGNDLSKFKISK